MQSIENGSVIQIEVTKPVMIELLVMKVKESKNWKDFFLTIVDKQYGTNLMEMYKETVIKKKE